MITVDDKDLYRAFTPCERITLMLEAMARDDHTERNRLVMSCPKFTYTASDSQYTDGMDEAYAMASMAACSLRYFTGQVLAVEAVKRGMEVLIPPLNDLPELAFWEGYWIGKFGPQTVPSAEPPAEQGDNQVDAKASDLADAKVANEPDVKTLLDQLQKCDEIVNDKIFGLLDYTSKMFARGLATTWHGFGCFTRAHLRVEPEILLRAMGLEVDQETTDILDRYADAKPHEEAAARFTAAMFGRWQRRYLSKHKRETP